MTKGPKTLTDFCPALHHVNVCGLFREFYYIYPSKTKYFYIDPPTLKKFLGPLPAWVLGRCTPGLCPRAGPDYNTLS